MLRNNLYCISLLRSYLIAAFGISALVFSHPSAALSHTHTIIEKTWMPFATMGYVKIQQLPRSIRPISPIRLQALRETATSLGAQGALAWKSERINDTLKRESRYLDQIFDFNRLLIDRNILPPIVVESNGDLHLSDPSTIRQAAKTYRIVASARFVTAPPTWRDYLPMHYPIPTMPNTSLLPKTQSENAAWNYYIRKGWHLGLQQAATIFSSNLSRLKRNYLGIILYRQLLAKNMISAPIISTADLGITGNQHYIRIQDQVMRITAQSALNLKSKQWKPILTHPN